MSDRQFRSSDRRFGVQLSAWVLADIDRWCREAHPAETGGVLVGAYSPCRTLAHVAQASSPPSDSAAGPTWFFRGIGRLNDLLRNLWSAPKRTYYVGEWHYHAVPCAEPSPQDIAQLRAIAHNPQYNCPEPILVIVGSGSSPRPLHVEVATSSGRRILTAEQCGTAGH